MVEPSAGAVSASVVVPLTVPESALVLVVEELESVGVVVLVVSVVVPVAAEGSVVVAAVVPVESVTPSPVEGEGEDEGDKRPFFSSRDLNVASSTQVLPRQNFWVVMD